VSNTEGSVDFLLYQPEVLLTEVGVVSELITHIHVHIRIQGTGRSKVRVDIMLVNFVVYMELNKNVEV
jgi:hypothetical protein